ncbi:uncharacterized protein LOC120352023 [Nilaparvata lugens]|uniref:uncharacterized protein LOC120352023 n=1 Tax=Nilaparvata lugens TaxID=108931 RepID=UPI00193E2945|nr:uncharacterized protein LOC120352023 [Nilaparvata lugens]
MRGKLSFTSEPDLSILHTLYEMSSPSSSQSFILPDSAPAHQRILNYWQRKAALAAESSPAVPVPSPLSVEPPSPGGEIIIPDSPLQRLAPAATWTPWRVVLTTVSNKQKQAKRRLLFEKPEVSGDEEEEEQSICSQTKKRAGIEHDSSLALLIKEVEDFVQLINKPLPKPWIPLRELKEDLPYPIISAQEDTNKHGRRRDERDSVNT